MSSHWTSVRVLLCIFCTTQLYIICQGVCPPPPVIPNSAITQNGGNNTGDSVFYVCTPSQAYEQQHDIFRHITCMANGSWSMPYPECKLTTYQQCAGQEWRHYGFNSRYSAAAEQCVEDGGTLSNIRSDSDRACARQVIPADFHDGFTEYWIGVEDRDGDGVYQWLSDNATEPADSENWNPRQTIGGSQCGFHRVGHLNQLSTNCILNQRAYLCTRPIPKFITCNGFEWRYFTSAYQWEHAEVECQQQRGHLATLHTEQDSLCGLEAIRGTSAQPPVFAVGLYFNVTTNTFNWTGDPSLQPDTSPLWLDGLPTPGPNECGYWIPMQNIRFLRCSTYTYICQRPLQSQTNPTSPTVTDTSATSSEAPGPTQATATATTNDPPITPSTTEPQVVVTRQYPAEDVAASFDDPLSQEYRNNTNVYLQCIFLSHHYIVLRWNTTSSVDIPEHEVLTNTNASLQGPGCGGSPPAPFAPSVGAVYTYKTRLLITDATNAMSGIYTCLALHNNIPVNSATFNLNISALPAAVATVIPRVGSSSVTATIWFHVLTCAASALLAVLVTMAVWMCCGNHRQKSYRVPSWLPHRSSSGTTSSITESQSVPATIFENSKSGLSSRKPTIVPRPDWTMTRSTKGNKDLPGTPTSSAPLNHAPPASSESTPTSPTSTAGTTGGTVIAHASSGSQELPEIRNQKFYISVKAPNNFKHAQSAGDKNIDDTDVAINTRAVQPTDGRIVAQPEHTVEGGHDGRVTGDGFRSQIVGNDGEIVSKAQQHSSATPIALNKPIGEPAGCGSAFTINSRKASDSLPVQATTDNEHSAHVRVAPAYCFETQNCHKSGHKDSTMYLSLR